MTQDAGPSAVCIGILALREGQNFSIAWSPELLSSLLLKASSSMHEVGVIRTALVLELQTIATWLPVKPWYIRSTAEHGTDGSTGKDAVKVNIGSV